MPRAALGGSPGGGLCASEGRGLGLGAALQANSCLAGRASSGKSGASGAGAESAGMASGGSSGAIQEIICPGRVEQMPLQAARGSTVRSVSTAAWFSSVMLETMPIRSGTEEGTWSGMPKASEWGRAGA